MLKQLIKCAKILAEIDKHITDKHTLKKAALGRSIYEI